MTKKKGYVIRFRKGRPILVDKQILRWRKFRKKLALAAAASAPKHEAPSINALFYTGDEE